MISYNDLQLIQEKGGRFTLSDDCHGPNDVGMHYDKLGAYLKEVNVDTIHYLVREDDQVIIKENNKILQDPFWKHVQEWQMQTVKNKESMFIVMYMLL